MAAQTIVAIAIIANLALLVSTTVKKCPKNEVFSVCPQSIRRAQNCTEKGNPVKYITHRQVHCIKGCVCKSGYLRAKNKTCIPEQQCPLNCGENEYQSNCPAQCKSDYCPISEKDNEVCSTPKTCPPPACKCRFNYRRSKNGTCIPTRSCPPLDCSARPYEESNLCPPLCPTDDCSQASPSGQCPEMFGRIGIILPCNPKCRCIKGYWRKNGTCVPYGECPGVCPPHEVYSSCVQGVCRAVNCTQRGLPIACQALASGSCKSGCVCEEKYLRAANGTCVPENQCGTGVCPPHEVYSSCVQGVCRAVNCTQRGLPIACPLLVSGSCKSGCVCEENYLRAANGTCVPENQCGTGVCPPHEVYSSCVQGVCRAVNCTQRGLPIACPSLASGSCKSGCICEEKYLRAANGTCVPENQCGSLLNCGENEYQNNCPAQCKSDYCPTSEKDLEVCSTPKTCPPPACKCRFNFRRSKNGTCIPTRSCPPFDCSARPNEEYNLCPPLCPTDDCSQASPSGQCPRRFGRIGIILSCNPKCRCIKGYWRKNGTCVPYGECPRVCPPHEVYSSCVQGVCRAVNCTQRGSPIACQAIASSSCKSGCVCEEKYLRAANGTCVPENQCGTGVCPPHEVYSSCVQGVCRAVNCTQRGLPIACPSLASGSCKSGCVCEEKYLRAANGTCVPENQCGTRVCPPHEEHSSCVQGVCRAVNCTQRGLPVACPLLVSGSCKSGCVCQEKYLRAANGACVPENQCGTGVCPPHEVYSSCIEAVYRAANCTQRGLPVACPSEASGSCKPGCVCEKKYMRADNGTCVPKKQNETGVCPPHEVYSSCIEAVYRAANCTQRGSPVACPPEALGSCKSGCVCEKEYVRADNGTCVPKKQNGTGVCPPHEVYSSCVQGVCRAVNCTQRSLPIACPLLLSGSCKSGCVCEEKYLRAANGTCVPENQCGTGVCPPHEVYSTCIEAMYRAANCTQRGLPVTCPSVALGSCKSGCVCEKTYVRADNGTCVPKKQYRTCPKNEVYTNSKVACPPQTCFSLVAKFRCQENQTVESGCVCAPGYLRTNASEPCVPICQCPQIANTPDCKKKV